MRLGGKLALAVAILMVGAGVLLNTFFGSTLEAFLVEHARAGLLRQIRLATQQVAGQLDGGAPDRIANALGDQLEVRVTLIGSNGVVLGDSRVLDQDLPLLDNHGDREEVLEAKTGGFGRSVRFSDTFGVDMLYVAGPVPGHPGLILRLAIPMSELRESRQALQGVLWVAVLISLIAILAMSHLLYRLLTRHITYLTHVVRSMRDGDLTHRADVSGTSTREIRDLAAGLNELRQQTQERIDQVLVENSRLEAVLASISEGIMVTERNGRIRMTNRQFDQIFGAQETAGRMPIEAVRNNDVQNAVTETLESAEGRVLEIVLPGVLERNLDVHAAPILQDGACIGSVTVFYDISELRRLEQVRKDFVANVSHELRTPLTSIKGCAATLADGALSDEKAAKRFVDSINAHAGRLHNLVDDLLDLSRLESEGMTIEQEVMDLTEAVDSAMETVSGLAREKGIQVGREFDTSDRTVGDPGLIRQAIVNLLDNAIKYTDPGGTVTVRLGTGPIPENGGIPIASPEPTQSPFEDTQVDTGAVLYLEVTDTGIGIPSEDLPRVFERFYRVDRGRSRAMGGTGLGLAIVRHIVESHGQRVYVRSAFGEGATFGFSIASEPESL